MAPARRMLFATGHFLHDYVVRDFIDRSELREHIYAEWTCTDYRDNPKKHTKVEDTYGNVITKDCKCGKPLNQHNEITVGIPFLVGHPDLVFLINDTYYIWEFKTYNQVAIPFDDLTQALPSHRLQVSCYFKMLQVKAKREGRRVSTRLVVMYIDRSNSKLFGGQPFKSFSFQPYAEKHLARIKNSVAHFRKGVEKKVLPDRICSTIRDKRARECECAVECWLRRTNRVG